MMKTSERARAENITFAAVHDSFWSHACDIDRVGEILREEFVDVHSQPLLEILNENFSSRYPHSKFPEIPELGKFDLEEVKGSTYFFS